MRLIDAHSLEKSIRKNFEGVTVYDVAPSEAVGDFEDIVDREQTVGKLLPETVYVAVDDEGTVHTLRGSSSETRFYQTEEHAQRAINRHNLLYSGKWRIAKCQLMEVL